MMMFPPLHAFCHPEEANRSWLFNCKNLHELAFPMHMIMDYKVNKEIFYKNLKFD